MCLCFKLTVIKKGQKGKKIKKFIKQKNYSKLRLIYSWRKNNIYHKFRVT